MNVYFGLLKVQQLDILSPFSLPSKEKSEEEKENKFAKPVLNKFLVIRSIFTHNIALQDIRKVIKS